MLVWQATSVEHVMYALGSMQSPPAVFPTSCIFFCNLARENVSRVIVDYSVNPHCGVNRSESDRPDSRLSILPPSSLKDRGETVSLLQRSQVDAFLVFSP